MLRQPRVLANQNAAMDAADDAANPAAAGAGRARPNQDKKWENEDGQVVDHRVRGYDEGGEQARRHDVFGPATGAYGRGEDGRRRGHGEDRVAGPKRNAGETEVP